MLFNYLYNLFFAKIHFSLKIIDVCAKFIFFASGCFAVEGSGSSFNRALFERLTLYTSLKRPITYTIGSSSSTSSSSSRIIVASSSNNSSIVNDVWKDDIYIQGYAESHEKIKIRIYLSSNSKSSLSSSSPFSEKESATPPPLLPALLYFHGGGFCVSHIDSFDYDNMCSDFARSGLSVISVEYRLAPEHRFPAAIEDAYAALRWCQLQKNMQYDNSNNNISNMYQPVHELLRYTNFGRLIVGGDSAGGNISAVLSHLARNNLGPELSLLNANNTAIQDNLIKQLLLIYPSVDRLSKYKSNTDFQYGFIIPKAVTDFFTSSYKPTDVELDAFNGDLRVSPIFFFDNNNDSNSNNSSSNTNNNSNESSSGGGESPGNAINAKSNRLNSYNYCVAPFLPPTTIIVAGLDPLKDAGIRYASTLGRHGVKVNFLEVEDTVHGFITLRHLDETKRTMKFISESICS